MYLTHNNGKCVANNDLLEPLIIKFTNIWLQYQKNVYIKKIGLYSE